MLVEIGGMLNVEVDVEALGKGVMDVVGVVVAASLEMGVSVGVGVTIVKTIPNLF